MKRRSIFSVLLAVLNGLVVTSLALIMVSSSSPLPFSFRARSACRAAISAPPSAREVRPYPQTDQRSPCGPDDPMCLYVVTGTVRSTCIITNPNGVTGFEERKLANYEQRLISQTPTSIKIELIGQHYLDTDAPYPVDAGALPADVQAYLEPEPGWIQSDHPGIVATAEELVAGATMQAQAVDAIVAWVSANIAYEGGHPSDAASTFENRAAVCGGFSTLTAALMRAAGIPAAFHSGCVGPWGEGLTWMVGESGGPHGWNEVYYPDIGWAAMDPQLTINYLDTAHIVGGFDQCYGEGTVMTRTQYQVEGGGLLYDLATPYLDPERNSLWTASVSGWDRDPLRVSDASPSVMLAVDDPVGDLTFRVEDMSCRAAEEWELSTQAAWLSPTLVTGHSVETVSFAVEASGMSTGVYTSPMTLELTSAPSWWEGTISRTLTARLWIVDRVYQAYLPLVMRSR